MGIDDAQSGLATSEEDRRNTLEVSPLSIHQFNEAVPLSARLRGFRFKNVHPRLKTSLIPVPLHRNHPFCDAYLMNFLHESSL